MDPFYNLRLQARGWLVANQQTQAQLSKLVGLSESFISDFLSGECPGISAPNFMKLQQVVSSPLVNQNAGARITSIQTFSRKIKGDLNLSENLEAIRAQQMQLNKRVETITEKMEKIRLGQEVSLIDPRTEDTI
jgi:hypothetical protein